MNYVHMYECLLSSHVLVSVIHVHIKLIWILLINTEETKEYDKIYVYSAANKPY